MSAGVGFTEAQPTAGEAQVERVDLESQASTSSTGKTPVQQEARDREVQELVRKFTTQSEHQQLGSPFDADAHGGLDPRSDQFRAKNWARSFYNLRYSSAETIPRVAGVAFRSLNVWGKGSPTDFQSTVGNTILKLPSLFGKGTQKIEILRDLDGLLLPGEQLCVLGPPGYVQSFSNPVT
jgi:ATP-binding cassette subfamily G (WHITE) protein 2 (PDR)